MRCARGGSDRHGERPSVGPSGGTSCAVSLLASLIVARERHPRLGLNWWSATRRSRSETRSRPSSRSRSVNTQRNQRQQIERMAQRLSALTSLAKYRLPGAPEWRIHDFESPGPPGPLTGLPRRPELRGHRRARPTPRRPTRWWRRSNLLATAQPDRAAVAAGPPGDPRRRRCDGHRRHQRCRPPALQRPAGTRRDRGARGRRGGPVGRPEYGRDPRQDERRGADRHAAARGPHATADGAPRAAAGRQQTDARQRGLDAEHADRPVARRDGRQRRVRGRAPATP